jgi:hypothetical protein
LLGSYGFLTSVLVKLSKADYRRYFSLVCGIVWNL